MLFTIKHLCKVNADTIDRSRSIDGLDLELSDDDFRRYRWRDRARALHLIEIKASTIDQDGAKKETHCLEIGLEMSSEGFDHLDDYIARVFFTPAHVIEINVFKIEQETAEAAFIDFDLSLSGEGFDIPAGEIARAFG